MRAAVLGSPVAHSLSPVLHLAAYARLGLDWTYDLVECTPERLPGFVAGLGPEWAGLSLTMPLKTAVLPLLDVADDAVRDTGAANTLVLSAGPPARRMGANTDVPGLVAALAEAGVRAPSPGRAPAVVLGGGATARSAVVSLARSGWASVDLVVRRPEAARDVVSAARAQGLTVRVHAWDLAPVLVRGAPVVVSTVPAGAADALAADVPDRPGVLFDVVYDPWPTPLSAAWAAAGGTVLGGLDLLVHQAALQVRLMTGCSEAADVLVEVMRPAGEAELSRRASSTAPDGRRRADPLKA